MRGVDNRAAALVAVLAIAASGAVWAGCGGSSTTNSVSREANKAINQAEEKANEAIGKAKKQLNEANIPQKAQEQVNKANKKLNEAQGEVNETAQKAKEQLNNSGH